MNGFNLLRGLLSPRTSRRPKTRATPASSLIRFQKSHVEAAYLRPRPEHLRSRCQRLSAQGRRDRIRHRQRADHARKARQRFLQGGDRLLPGCRGHHLRRYRSDRAQLLHPAGPRNGRPPGLSGHAGLPSGIRARRRCQASAVPVAIAQGGDDLAPSGACLQRVRRLPVRRRRRHGGRWRRQLPLRRVRAISRDRHRDPARPRVGELLQIQRQQAGMPEKSLDGARSRIPQR